MIGSDQVGAESVGLEGDELLLSELLRGVPVSGAATTAGVSEATARRRMRDVSFRRRLDEGRRELMSTLAAQLAGSAELGYAVLRKVALDDEAPPSVRVKAAMTLIDYAASIGERVDLTTEVLERVRALELEQAPRRVAAA